MFRRIYREKAVGASPSCKETEVALEWLTERTSKSDGSSRYRGRSVRLCGNSGGTTDKFALSICSGRF